VEDVSIKTASVKTEAVFLSNYRKDRGSRLGGIEG
jgi:hypothetical protein